MHTLVAAHEWLARSHATLSRAQVARNGPGAPSLQQPPSTSDTHPPPPGAGAPAATAHVGGRRRRALRRRSGWRHPPDHLNPEQVRWEPAPEPTGPLL